MQAEVYVIGGFVRDKLIGRPTSDADIVCIGNAIDLANEVASLYDPRPAVAFLRISGRHISKFVNLMVRCWMWNL